MPAPDRLAALTGENVRLRRQLGEAERRLRDVERRLGNRVRTCLSTLGAVVQQTARRRAELEHFSHHLHGRIGALARAHETAMRDPSGTVELHHLIAEELLAHAALEGEQVTLSGPPLWLCGRAVDTFWLAIHELAVNSIKFGALSNHQGHVAVVWTVGGELPRSLRLQWSERDGPPIAVERESGFGTEMIERMLRDGLGGEGMLAFTPGGVNCVIDVPTSMEVSLDRPAFRI